MHAKFQEPNKWIKFIKGRAFSDNPFSSINPKDILKKLQHPRFSFLLQNNHACKISWIFIRTSIGENGNYFTPFIKDLYKWIVSHPRFFLLLNLRQKKERFMSFNCQIKVDVEFPPVKFIEYKSNNNYQSVRSSLRHSFARVTRFFQVIF